MQSIYDSNKKILLSVSLHQSGWQKSILFWCESIGKFLCAIGSHFTCYMIYGQKFQKVKENCKKKFKKVRKMLY